jgi:hypothetical protein
MAMPAEFADKHNDVNRIRVHEPRPQFTFQAEFIRHV